VGTRQSDTGLVGADRIATGRQLFYPAERPEQTTDSSALRDEGDGSPHAQFAFAKAIVYNANLRVSYLLDGF